MNNTFENLFDLAAALNHQQQYAEALRLVTRTACTMLSADVALILMINPQTRETVKTLIRYGQSTNDTAYNLVQQQVSGWLMKYRKPLLCQRLHQDERFGSLFREHSPDCAVLGVPLEMEDAIIGTLILFRDEQSPAFAEADIAILQKIALIATPYLRKNQDVQAYFTPPPSPTALADKYRAAGLFGKSPAFRELLEAVEAAARCDVRVLLEGRSGTGKELIARSIHRHSQRRDQPFVAIDCGAIAPHLIESELFGYVKGAFTGAITDRKGLIEAAEGGTLFMDEIANLPMDMQSKLLRVLQESEIRPLGSAASKKVNVRIIAAASISLRELVADGKFREDLFYRLHVYPVNVPALAERREDIPLLANHFLKIFATQQQKQAKYFHESLLDFMRQREWPGNIRELENFVERLVTLASPAMIHLDASVFPKEIEVEFREYFNARNSRPRISLTEQLQLHEKEIITNALISNEWNQRQAARALNISEGTIRNKMKVLGIQKLP